MKTLNLRIVLTILTLTVLSMGCKPPECRQMVKCCEEVKDIEGVGPACGSMATELSNESTCKSVLQTIGYMLEDRKLAVPDVCR